MADRLTFTLTKVFIVILVGQRMLARTCEHVMVAVRTCRLTLAYGTALEIFRVKVNVEVERFDGNEAEAGTSMRWPRLLLMCSG